MHKLVRDKIPDIMRAQGKNPKVRTTKSDAEYIAVLHDKLLEEAHEFIEAAAENNDCAMRELADILEVVEAICLFKKYEVDLIQKYKTDKKFEKGGFEKRILLLNDSFKKK